MAKKDDRVTVEYSVGGRAMSLEEAATEVLKGLNGKGKVKETTEWLRYDFSNDELLDKARELGRAGQEISCLESQLDSVKKDLNAKIAALEATRGMLGNHVTSGYEMRNLKCEIRYNDPEDKTKTVVRVDTGEVIRTAKMESHELQEEIDFEKAAEKPGAETTA